MELPFTTEQFLEVLKSYNQNVFPMQIVFYMVAIVCVYFLFKPIKNSSKIISAVLAFFWLWIGVVYNLAFFTSINKAAYFFALLFVVQGILFAVYGIAKGKQQFEYQKNIYNYIGTVFILYGLVIYPILGYLFGHKYPHSPTFGLPCPTTIFTFGVLLFFKDKISAAVLIIPLIWSLIGFSAALTLTITEDYGLLIAGVLGFVLLLVRNKKLTT